LGYLNLIGLYPGKLNKGKKIYKSLIKFIKENQLLDQYTNSILASTIMDKLVLYVQKRKWHNDTIILAEDFGDELLKAKNVDLNTQKYYDGPVYNKVTYGVIEKKVEKEVYTETDLQLTAMLKEFNEWLNDYLESFSKIKLYKSELIQLLKIILSK